MKEGILPREWLRRLALVASPERTLMTAVTLLTCLALLFLIDAYQDAKTACTQDLLHEVIAYAGFIGAAITSLFNSLSEALDSKRSIQYPPDHQENCQNGKD